MIVLCFPLTLLKSNDIFLLKLEVGERRPAQL